MMEAQSKDGKEVKKR